MSPPVRSCPAGCPAGSSAIPSPRRNSAETTRKIKPAGLAAHGWRSKDNGATYEARRWVRSPMTVSRDRCLPARSSTSTDRKDQMMISAKLLASVALVTFITANISLAAEPAAPQAAKAQIGFTADTAYPESVTWSAKQNRFFVSSVRHGTVGVVTPDGKYTPFIADDRLVSTVGLLVDDERNTLWVTNSDPGAGERTNAATQGKLAGIATFGATTGKRLAYYDLGHLSEGTHLANDVALDADGNAYVTDSFAPVIYRITKAGEASIFAQSPLVK